MNAVDKRFIAMRYWLQGRGYMKAALAMEFAKEHHTGTRKDGSPEFSHQISIAQYLRTLESGLAYPEETFAVAFLHDVREDYDVSDEEIRSRFGDLIADAVDALSKEVRGVRRPEAEVFAAIAGDEIASIVKGADRIHNHQTMVGVFTQEKQEEYLEETKTWFLPMLKTARRAFPRQEPLYENIKTLLSSQIHLIEAIHAARLEATCDLQPA